MRIFDMIVISAEIWWFSLIKGTINNFRRFAVTDLLGWYCFCLTKNWVCAFFFVSQMKFCSYASSFDLGLTILSKHIKWQYSFKMQSSVRMWYMTRDTVTKSTTEVRKGIHCTHIAIYCKSYYWLAVNHCMMQTHRVCVCLDRLYGLHLFCCDQV